jgi:hypothetical protein
MIDRTRRGPFFAWLLATLGDRWWFALPALTLLLLTPTILRGQPFLDWDTAQYYHYGAQLVGFATAKIVPTLGLNVSERSEIAKQQGSGNLDDGLGDRARNTSDEALIDQKSQAGGMAFYGSRSPFYSMWLYSVASVFNLWAVLTTQAVATAWIIWRATTHAAGAHRFEAGITIVTLSTFGAGAWFVTGFVMPDIYAGVAVICVALLFAYADRMSSLERVGLAAILAASVTFHATHLVVAGVLTLAGIGATHFLRSEGRPLRVRALLATGSALGVAVALQFAFDAAARAVLGASPKRPPILMARVLADGPGRLYLASVCPETPFLVCAYSNRSFKSADEFLWSSAGVFQTMSVEQRLRLIDEEPRFVTAVAMHYPLSVLKAAVANAIEQFVLVWPAEAWMDPGVSFSDPALSGADLFQVAPFLSLCVANLGSCVPALPEALIASSIAITLFLSFAVIAAHFVAAWRRTTGTQQGNSAYKRAIVFASLILVGLVVNAGICGAISGPHARYQTRVVWLAVLAAGVLEAAHPVILPWFRRLFAGASQS